MLRQRLISLIIGYLYLSIASANCWAQMTAVTNSTSTPIPGVGHDYIKMLSETVNPANGSVSVRLQVPIPPGRGITIPFFFAYDSNGVHFPISATGEPGVGAYGTVYVSPSSQVPTAGGWSYSVPMLSYDSLYQSIPNPQNCTYTATAGYVFQDATGSRHSLGISHADTPPPNCSPYYFEQDSAQDDYYQAMLSGGTVPVIVDSDGTVYTFPNTDFVGTGVITSVLPVSIEDRNGNIVKTKDTLGRTAISWSGFGTTGNTVTVSGLSSSYSITWGTAPFNFNPQSESSGAGANDCMGLKPAQASQAVITAIKLPNGKQYSFSYDSTFGELSQITYPDGGYVRYTWGYNPLSGLATFVPGPQDTGNVPCEWIYSMPAITDRYVFDGNATTLHQHFAYQTTWSGATWTSKVTTVTTTDQGRQPNVTTTTTYTYGSVPGPTVPNMPTPPGDNQIPVELKVVYQNSGGTTLRTVNKTWFDQYELKSNQDTLDNGLSSLVAFTYGPGAQVTEKDEYDFGSGTSGGLLRKTITNYQPFSVTPIYSFAASIFDRPCRAIVYDSTGTNRVAETDYFYDGSTSTTPCATAPTQALPGTGNYTGHDDTNYSPASAPPRGNANRIALWFTAASPVTTFTFDETGQVLSITDPCGNATCSDMTGTTHATAYSYANSYSSGTPPGNTNAYLTKKTDALGHSTSFTYGYSDGQLTSSKDPNTQITSYKYNTPPSGCALPDGLDRLSEIDYPDFGKTTFCYNDSPYNSSTPSPNVTITKAVTSGSNEVSITAFDGTGHAVKTILSSDPTGATYSAATYDGLDRKYQVYNPTRCSPPTTNCGESTWGVTTYAYDALGRVLSVTNPDSSIASTSYKGRATEVSDEGNGTRSVQRISQVDGLGRLTNVCEVTSNSMGFGITPTPTTCGLDITPATGFLTSYQYDALSNLKSVTQGGLNGRSFIYDSLSRLLTANNPESGTMVYSYDANGNLYQRTSPKLNPSGQSTVTTYAYDVLNRLTGKTYNDGTSSANFSYDQTTAWGETLTNPIGRLTQTSADNTLAQALFSYDPMGRVTTQFQCTPLTCGTTSIAFFFGYDLLGDLTSNFNNGDNVTYTNSYDAAARLTSVKSSLSDSQHPGTLITLANFTPFQKPQQVTLGNGIVETLSYSNRNQIYSMNETPTNIYAYNIWNFGNNTIGYAPDGNILYSNDSANGNWAYTYNDLNQLITGSCSANCPPTAGFNYNYDRFGNRWQEIVTAGMGIQPGYDFDANNHINVSGVTYDGAGNILYDGIGLGNTYTYDAENRIITAGNGSYTASYVYDAEGHRVRATVSGQTRDFLYDLSGRTIDEFVPGGSGWLGTWARGEAYAGGLHIATYANNTTEFDNSDWLNTFHARSDVLGNRIETCTSMPFGEDLTCTGPGSNPEASPIHFTGKERDNESGLDNFGARYYGSSLGRFMRPDDPFADQDTGDPQSWNLYSYVRNNPLSNTDPSGNACVQGSDGKYSDDNSGGESCAQVDVNNATTGPSVTVQATTDDVSYQLASGVANLTSTSSLSEVGVNGILGAQTAEGIWSLPSLFRSGADLIASWRMASKMAGVRAAGETGEALAGIVKNTERIPSLSGTAAYRVPDILDNSAKVIGEVKNYNGTVSLTAQIKDDIAFAQQNGYTMVLKVSQSTQLSQPLQQLVTQGTVKLVKF